MKERKSSSLSYSVVMRKRLSLNVAASKLSQLEFSDSIQMDELRSQ